MLIQTERLILNPLSNQQLELWMHDLPKLEQKLRCTYDADTQDGIFCETIRKQLMIETAEKQNNPFQRFWLVIRKQDRAIVGTVEFKGEPNENGEVEIAYGLVEKYFRYGYMTETIEAICHWAKKQPRVRAIVAETESDNIKSQDILLQCGFYQEEKLEDTIWWRFT